MRSAQMFCAVCSQEACAWILAGILLGVLLSYATGQLLVSQISGVSVRDPLTLALVAATMAIAGRGACNLPARRATRVDPLAVLRCE